MHKFGIKIPNRHHRSKPIWYCKRAYYMVELNPQESEKCYDNIWGLWRWSERCTTSISKCYMPHNLRNKDGIKLLKCFHMSKLVFGQKLIIKIFNLWHFMVENFYSEARMVTRWHMMGTSEVLTYAPIVSKDGARVCLTIAALTDLKVLPYDI